MGPPFGNGSACPQFRVWQVDAGTARCSAGTASIVAIGDALMQQVTPECWWRWWLTSSTAWTKCVGPAACCLLPAACRLPPPTMRSGTSFAKDVVGRGGPPRVAAWLYQPPRGHNSPSWDMRCSRCCPQILCATWMAQAPPRTLQQLLPLCMVCQEVAVLIRRVVCTAAQLSHPG